MVTALAEQGEPGNFSEGHHLDAKTVKRIPKEMVGRCLSSKEAQQLLKRLEKR
jgi:hemolysin activation/secretion protein